MNSVYTEHLRALSPGEIDYRFRVYSINVFMVLENPAFFSSILALDLSRIPLSYGRIYIRYHLIGRLFLPEISVAFTGMVIHSHVRFGYSLPS